MTSPIPGIQVMPSTDMVKVDQKSDTILEQIMDRITVASEVPFLKVLIYCRTGLGKTWFTASAPRPFIYDVDGTCVSLDHSPYKQTPFLPYVSEFQCERLLDKLIEDKIKNPYTDEPIETFGFDSMTTFVNRSLKTQIRAQLGIKDDSKDTSSMLLRYLSGDQDWIANSQYIEDIINKLSKIQKHVIVSCHHKSKKDASTGLDTWLSYPDLSPKIYQRLSHWANVIGHMDKDPGGTRILQIQPTKTIDAKSHIGGPEKIMNPTFQSLLNIKDGKNK